jgi:pimeloyl-ACP methyl ester carboxylesterase
MDRRQKTMSEIKLRSDPTKLKNMHVLFIHGLGGDADNTWLQRDSKEQSWPLWLLEDSDDLNIWSIEYSAPKLKFNNSGMGIPDHATNILEHILKIPALSEGEIIFVCHSLGGLITKQILRIANDQTTRPSSQEFLGRVSGVAFLATPHLGSDISSLGNQLIPRLMMRSLALLKPSIAAASLSRNDPNLRELNTWYREWVSNRIIRHLVLTETESMYGFIDVVKQDSADPGLVSTRAIPIAANHENICKPKNKNDDIYIQVKGFINQKKRGSHEIWLTSRFASNVNFWDGYDNWAKCPSGVLEEYLIDDKIRLIDSTSKNSEGLRGVAGINALRLKLLQSNSSIRLIGLSGVGKTRFAQALFDRRIGENLISTENTFYTDIANSPSPTPRILAEKLVSEGKDAQLVVDNCPPELHRTLTSICTSGTSKVNLLTIEYDIREDQPEQTEVFSLEPSSIELIEKILNARYPNLGQQNSRTISAFSGGNSRIAIALAETIGKDENISSLKDEELFKRLFYQRHEKEKSLEKTAQVLSLIYSFQINSEKAYSDDLIFLSNLSEISQKDIYAGAAELKRRSLVQQRSIWMAVLPHPIANRLAKYALENISPAIILRDFNEATDERLLKSFSRRLGYLPQCNEAIAIINNWFTENGLLEKLHSNNRNDLAWVLIGNIAPIAVKEVLIHIKKLASQPEFCTRKNKQFIAITRLIRSIAYEEKHFDQCAKLLCQFALSENKEENNNSIRNILKSLFQLYLSGTHATKEQRLRVIDDLINTKTQGNAELAFQLLSSSLEAWHFSASHGFDFGANPRDYGYRPKTNQDVDDWYTLFINYTAELIISGSSHSTLAKEKLGKKLRGLWRQSNLRDLMEKTCLKIGDLGVWNDGFAAIHDILKWDCKSSDETEIMRLKSIAEQLSPKSLLDDIYMYVLADKWTFHDLEEFDDEGILIEHGYKKGQQYSKELGLKFTSTDNELVKSMLTKLLSYKGTSSNLFEFGEGAAQGAQDNNELLAMTISALEQLPEKERNLDFLCGQINYHSKHSIELTNTFLDSLITHPTLKQHFAWVQLSCALDSKSIARIVRALKEKTSPIWVYRNLASGRRHEPIPDDQLCEILDLIWQQDGGQEVAIEILSMRFHGLQQNQDYTVSDLLKKKSASLLALCDYSKARDNSGIKDYSLTQIANVCFLNNANESYAVSVFTKIKENILGHFIARIELPDFLSTMIEMHPILALEIFIGEGVEVDPDLRNAIKGSFDRKTSPFSKVDAMKTFEWCDSNREERYPKLASIITTYQTIERVIEWTPLAIELLKRSPEPIKVLDEYSSGLHPTSWMGSRAQILESRLPLFEQLMNFSSEEIVTWATDQKIQWKKFIASEYEREVERDIDRDERFEW